MKTENVTWTQSKIPREQRWKVLSQKGAVIWLTGLSGAGKTTLAVGVEHWLHQRDRHCFVLDGDNLRHGLCGNLGFSESDRVENVRRAGEAAKLIAESGIIAICALISPFSAERNRLRAVCAADGTPYAEVFISTPLEVCEERDAKGLYKRARLGEIKMFTGIDSPYEAPSAPDLVIDTGQASIPDCVGLLGSHILDLTRLSPS
jgi:adenylyl-sulfate kinase